MTYYRIVIYDPDRPLNRAQAITVADAFIRYIEKQYRPPLKVQIEEVKE